VLATASMMSLFFVMFLVSPVRRRRD